MWKALLFIVLLTFVTSTEDSLQILFISGDATEVSRPMYSSLRGGSMLYIKAIGHNPDPTKNKVYVGTIECVIPADGVADTFITCETGDSKSSSSISNLPVTLISDGKSLTTSYPNSVYYYSSKTPYLRDVFPTAGFAGSEVHFYGIHRISDLGDG